MVASACRTVKTIFRRCSDIIIGLSPPVFTMTNNRTIQISLDHIVAEIIACPLVLAAAFQSGMYQIDCVFQQRDSRDVWRAAERELTSRFPHTSIDELISLRNRLWFDHRNVQSKQSIPIHEFVQRIAREFLHPKGTYAVPALPEAKHCRGGISSGEAPDPAARRAWRWLMFALPEDLLLAGLDQHGHSPTHVQVVSENVAALLRRGYAETHLHYGVAFDFSMAWAAASNIAGRVSASGNGLALSAFCSPGADHAEGDELAMGLLRGLIVRYLLGAFLKQRRDHTTQESFASWLIRLLKDPGKRPKNALSSDPGIIIRTVKEVLNGRLGFDPTAGNASTQFVSLQSLYNRWAKLSTRPFPKSLSEVQLLDPLSDAFPAKLKGPTVQLQFLKSGFEHIERHPDDNEFAKLFWQVERVRCHVYRHCVQRPLTPGLTNFVRFYERKSAIAGPLEKVLIESAAVLGGMDDGLVSLEVRTSPRKNRDAQRNDLMDLKQSFSGIRQKSPGKNLETGLVLHFLKKRGTAHDRGNPGIENRGDYADPGNSSQNPKGFRWEGYFVSQEKHAKAIGNALALKPDLLNVVRAIDVCRDEPGVPTWIMAPLYETVRSRVHALRTDWAARQGGELPRLRATAHVGEDFVHLASGIRFMDEALKWLQLGSGDRIGHGLALGVDAMDWARRSTWQAMPLEDRWFDLLWERAWHAEASSRFSSSRRVYVEDEILRLAERMFPQCLNGQLWTVPLAMQCYRALHDFRRLRRLGFPTGLPLPIPITVGLADVDTLVDRWLIEYLTGGTTYRRCRSVDWVESQQDGEATQELQRLVRQRYADLGITIEINPISNLLVGDLSDLQSHPLWRLAPRLGDHVGPSIRMCVGSDDPFPFATSLPEEYQFLFDSLVLAGKSQAEAREWLDLVREMGLESRFTLPVP